MKRCPNCGKKLIEEKQRDYNSNGDYDMLYTWMCYNCNYTETEE